ncbi:hypothetical protein J2W23_005879 [Variovorax boronicumulans]|uniref:hypothetical protein n=1 Tax=Variovorax boronicumulans TaxID=436515 RepID=UPI0027826DF4|nr:hypothetical protein [Variovorax boronicumulans]MDQ0017466.1 hypothetical protein [Variovorax boronicumulans]
MRHCAQRVDGPGRLDPLFSLAPMRSAMRSPRIAIGAVMSFRAGSFTIPALNRSK